jgi:hypothetical protein
MLHKNVLNSLRSVSFRQTSESTQTPLSLTRLELVPSGGQSTSKKASPLFDLISIAAPRCSSFFAEAAVLVLVLALLDRLMLKGRMEWKWVVGALGISAGLLAASILTEFSSRRWLRRQS